jgi:hypothetical protein
VNIGINNLLEAVGAFVLVGGYTTAVFHACRWFAQKWVEQKFAKQLAQLKAEQDAALRHIQSSIDHQIHRAKKLYDTEFEVLTKAWNMLQELRGHAVDTTRLAPTYTEWDNATSDEIRSVLDAEKDLTEEDKTRVIEADDPAEEFRVVYDLRRVSVYRATEIAFGHYLGSNGIFMRPEIRDRFKRLSILISLVFGEFASSIRRERSGSSHFMTLNTEGRVLHDELRDLIEGRLWSATETRGPRR